MSRIKDIIQHLESVAPLSYQESYDNSGLLTGNKDNIVTGVLVTLDVTEKVVEEALNTNCNLIIAHHPIIFKGLKTLTGSNYVERTVILALKNDIAIYAIHTNLDNVNTGVNKKICDKIGLVNTQVLSPKKDTLAKLVTFVPNDAIDKVKMAIFEAGAGQIGNYNDCNFVVQGVGEFTPNEKANPTIGKTNKPEQVNESRIEVLLPSHLSSKVLAALNHAHPYEEVAYYLTPLQNKDQTVGAGMIGELEEAMPAKKFLQFLKNKMDLDIIRHTALIKENIKTVAVCGGAGSFLLPVAIGRQADVFVSADFKYHEFFDAEDKIVIADIGHYESEVYTKDLIIDILSEKFSTFALNLSKTVTNPISYI
ncbi:MAG TPA: Nif3-like dinuclear metal center hexameric protein [Fulvivirga sp.]|nr:Nif3-like dinuclear metal center hexameric protein [Fulvivirga sp.]